jgi:hypothetical protein
MDRGWVTANSVEAILFIKEMKKKFHSNQKWRTEKTFAKYHELSLKFWIKFDQLLSIFHCMNES